MKLISTAMLMTVLYPGFTNTAILSNRIIQEIQDNYITSAWDHIIHGNLAWEQVLEKLEQRSSSSAPVTCRDEDGKPVDWWIAYKLPEPKKMKKKYRETNKFIENGTAYAYILSSNPEKGWTLSDLSVNDSKSVQGQTLGPIYQSNPDLLTLLYNDEHPNGPTSFDLGHTKGSLFGNRDSGVWLIHSVPHYPPYPNQSYSYPHTGQRYGQSFICLSLNNSAMESVGKQLLFNEPYVYGVNIPVWLNKDDFSSLYQAANGKHIKSPPFYNEAWLNTTGGVKLTSFAKHKKFGKDLYADFVAPALRIPLLVETWPNGPGRMPSRCSTPFIVENVAELEFPGIDKEDFSTKHDHAKWAISLDVKHPYVCIGDINRMTTQLKRGGGTTCFENYVVWKTFKSTIKSIEPCPRG